MKHIMVLQITHFRQLTLRFGAHLNGVSDSLEGQMQDRLSPSAESPSVLEVTSLMISLLTLQKQQFGGSSS